MKNYQAHIKSTKAGYERSLVVLSPLAGFLFLYGGRMQDSLVKYSLIIGSTKELGSESSFVARQLERHFEVWSAVDPSSQFSIRWVRNSLILETNSYYLLDKWLTLGKQFLAYTLNEEPAIAESEDYPELELEDAA
jgi:hypothetical protein